MSSSLFVCLFLFANLLVFSSCNEVQPQAKEATPRGVIPAALVGAWYGRLLNLNYLVIDLDGTIHGTLLGLIKLDGFITADVSVVPLWIDLHLDLGITIPAIYSLSVIDGVSVLNLALDLDLTHLLGGTAIRPLALTPLNTIVFKSRKW